MGAFKLLVTAGLGATVVAGGFLAFAEKGRDKLRDDVEAFFVAVASESYDEAFAMTSDHFQESISRASFEGRVQKGRFTEFTFAEWENAGFDDKGGVASGKILTGNDDSFTFDLNLVKADGKWLIDEIVADGSSPKQGDSPVESAP